MRNYLVFLVLLLLVTNINAQESESQGKPGNVSLKTNLLYDATGTFNLGLEFRTGERTSIDIPVNWNPWTFSENRKWKHVFVQPEFRWWLDETFKGHFFGFHAHYGFYNVSRLPNGPFSRNMANSRYEGWGAGIGASYGYRWNFSRHWGMEATIGLGYAYLDYDKYECKTCGDRLKSDTKNYFGPTKAGISLIYTFGGKKKPAPAAPVQTPVVTEPSHTVVYESQFTASFVTPQVEAVKRRNEAGQAYLDFAAGRWEVVPGYKDNAAELQKMYNLVETLKVNADATITSITIAGYASPEGSYQSNLTLSGKRATALKKQIKALYGFPESLFSVSGRGEDWVMLDTLVARSYMQDKYAILEIIRAGASDYDQAEGQLKALGGGAPYRYLLENIYPQLRRTDYQLHYTVAPFTIEKGKEVFRRNPGNLSLNEMFLIANTYPPGTASFNEVFETAARLFPGDDVANLNAAASALGRKDTASAARYLSRVNERNAAWWNNAGILAYLEGDMKRAGECFARAQAEGNYEAGRNGQELERHISSKG